MVYVTHNQLEAMTMADRIAVIDHSVPQQVGTPLDIYNSPCNVFVARFISMPGMNLLSGHLTSRNGRVAIDLGVAGCIEPIAGPFSAQAAEEAKTREVLVGVQPEDLVVEQGEGTAPLNSVVSFIERVGHRTIVRPSAGAPRR